jgi:hypothetical protein
MLGKNHNPHGKITIRTVVLRQLPTLLRHEAQTVLES